MSRKPRKTLRKRKLSAKESYAKKAKEVRSILNDLGILQLFEKLPRRLKEEIFKQTVKKVEVVLNKKLSKDLRAIEIQKTLLLGLATIKIPLKDYPAEFSFKEFWTVVCPLAYLLKGAKNGRGFPTLNQIENAKLCDWADEIYTDKQMFHMRLGFSLFLLYFFQRFNRFDSHIYFSKFEFDTSRNVFLNINKHPVEKEKIVIDGKERPTFKFGAADGMTGFKWAEWDADSLDIGSNCEKVEVYVQSHVFRRMQERLDCLSEDMMHASLTDSLIIPWITKYNGHLMVDLFHTVQDDRKLGYLPFTLVDGKVVIRTFLFLTMDSTPEGQKLYKKLKLRRIEIEHLALDRLSTFVGTDLASDPEIVQILTECGLDHLLLKDAEELSKMSPEEWARFRLGLKDGYAADFHSYLGENQSQGKYGDLPTAEPGLPRIG